MAVYANQADMVNRFSEDEIVKLTDRNRTDEIDVAVLTTALADASDEIDTYLQGRYALPLASIPKVLVRLCCELARYYLHNRHATEDVEERAKVARRTLKDISNGVLSLGLTTAEQLTQRNDSAQIATPERWTTNGLKGF